MLKYSLATRVNATLPSGADSWTEGDKPTWYDARDAGEGWSTARPSAGQLSAGAPLYEMALVQLPDARPLPAGYGDFVVNVVDFGPARMPTVTVDATFSTIPGCGCVGCAIGSQQDPSSVDLGDFAENGSGATTTSVTLSGNAGIDALLSGVRWNSAISYSDPDSSTDYQSGYFVDADGDFTSAQFEGFSRISPAMLAALRFVLDANAGAAADAGFSVEGFTNLGITYAGSGSGGGTIRVANSSDAFTAYAFYPDNLFTGGDSFFGPDARDPSAAGNYSWHTMIHEMGHALGLKHGHESWFGGALPSDIDSNEYSVMTYRSFVGGTTDFTTWEEWGAPQTFMMYDIAALQYMYGADFTTNSGNTTYSWSPTTGQTFINGAVAINPGGNRIFATIWDGGGIDTYDLSNYSTNLIIDLTPGGHSVFSRAQLSDLNGANWNGLGPQYARGNIFNALQYNGDPRSLIENATGGSGNDRLSGNVANNVLKGGGGNDTLNGRAGSDTMLGGSGNDTYVVSSTTDRVFETTTTTSTTNAGGIDTIRSSVSFNLDSSAGVRFVERLTLTGTETINATGNALNNTLIGNGARNSLNGGLGNDILTGGGGPDSFVFNTALGPGNVDRITDFDVLADNIRLENAVFAGLAVGTLSASAFVSNTSGNAEDASDRIIYDSDTGRLYYDRDGTGGAAKVHFATLAANLSLTNADFFVF